MQEHEFTLVLTTEPDEDQADRLYGVLDDGTICTIAGVPQIRFHREAATLEDAIRSAIAGIKRVGFDVLRIELEPELFAQTA